MNKIFSVQDITKINDLFPINEYTWLIATDRGLYKSNYKYDLENDLTYFDEKEVNDIYKSTLSTEVSEIVNDKIDSHVSIMHNDKSIIGLVNSKIQDVDVSKNVTNWYSTS
jgi:ABC-type transport system substrate-binding protein